MDFNYVGAYSLTRKTDGMTRIQTTGLECVRRCSESSTCLVVSYSKYACYHITDRELAMARSRPRRGWLMFVKYSPPVADVYTTPRHKMPKVRKRRLNATVTEVTGTQNPQLANILKATNQDQQPIRHTMEPSFPGIFCLSL